MALHRFTSTLRYLLRFPVLAGLVSGLLFVATAAQPATGLASVAGGKVTAVQIVNGGSGYLDRPLVSLVGGGGSNAMALATVFAGVVTDIEVTKPGSGYTTAPEVVIAGPQNTLEQGLLRAYNFDTNLIDLSGFGLNAVPHGVQYATNRFGQAKAALKFSGTNQFLEIPSPLPDLLSATVSVWVSLGDWYGVQALFFEGDGGGGRDFACYLYGGFIFTVRSDHQLRYTKRLPPTDTWMHLVMVADADKGQLEFWLDGQLAATAPFIAGGWGATSGQHSNLEIGRRSIYNDWYFNGYVDDLWIYGRALSAEEVQALYARQRGKPLSVQIAVSSYSITMNVQPGTGYQLQSSADLVTWSPVGAPFVAVAAEYSQEVPVADGAKYFRLLQAP